MYLAVHICQSKCLTFMSFTDFTGLMCFQALFGNYSFGSSGSITCFSYLGILYKTRRTFCFLFRQTSAIFIYPSMPSGTCVFFGRSRYLNSVLISLLSDDFFPPKKEYSQLVSVLTYFGSRFNSPKEDRYSPSKRKAAILYPTVYFVSGRTQTFIWQENAKHFLPVCF